jgi:hypothetical protein
MHLPNVVIGMFQKRRHTSRLSSQTLRSQQTLETMLLFISKRRTLPTCRSSTIPESILHLEERNGQALSSIHSARQNRCRGPRKSAPRDSNLKLPTENNVKSNPKEISPMENVTMTRLTEMSLMENFVTRR